MRDIAEIEHNGSTVKEIIESDENANLRDADLRYANLRDADLRYANLRDTDLPPTEITPQEGSFTAWKSARGATVKLKIPEDADRKSCYTSRKCRAEYVEVITVEYDSGEEPPARGHHDRNTTYVEGRTVHADEFDDDRRMECSNGIHFFMTKKEAENWG